MEWVLAYATLGRGLARSSKKMSAILALESEVFFHGTSVFGLHWASGGFALALPFR
jgi:hypothetical protein